MFLKPYKISRLFSRNAVTALYVADHKAHQQYAVLTPYFDFASKLKCKQTLQANLQHRNLVNAINLEELYNLWDVFKCVNDRKAELERRKIEIAGIMKKMKPATKCVKVIDKISLPTDTPTAEDLLNKYMTEGVLVREDLKMLKEQSYVMEEQFISAFLELPNDLHDKTPLNGQDSIHQRYLDKPSNDSVKTHLSYDQFIEYFDYNCYFLKDKAAHFELNLPSFCLNEFHNFTFLSNPDIVRSILTEGAGIDLQTSNPLFTIKDENNVEENKSHNALQLAGAGSMLSFLGYFAKLTTFKSFFPIKLISVGRKYENVDTKKDSLPGLYGTTQSEQVQLFIATENQEQANQTLDETLTQLIDFYEKTFNQHFRIRILAPSELHAAESLRYDVEMFSTNLGRYIAVGNLSLYDNFISKRLLFCYRGDDKLFKFPYIISGTVVNVARVLAILLENTGDLPDKFTDAVGS